MKSKLSVLIAIVLLTVCVCAAGAAEGLSAASAWSCPGCHEKIDAFFQFCPFCGAQRPDRLICPDCGYITTNPAYQFCPLCGASFRPENAEPEPPSPVLGLTIDKLSTRSGPSTAFTELGTYSVKNEYVPIISAASDQNGVIWLQCEVTYGGSLRRVYTGLKRFDASTFDISLIPDENVAGFVGGGALTSRDLTLRYGPGKEYGVCKQSIVTMDVAVVSIENGWAQVQFVCDKPLWRAWVPLENVVFDYSEG